MRSDMDHTVNLSHTWIRMVPLCPAKHSGGNESRWRELPAEPCV